MKIKFDVKSDPKSSVNLFTVYMEHKGEDSIELLITRMKLEQKALGISQTIEKKDVPIEDGILTMSKGNLKKFISALQLLAKS